MGKIVLFLLLIVNAFYSLINPWFGIAVGYLFNILGPQYIWWWHFQGVRAFYLIAIPTVIGFILSSIRGALSFQIIKNKLVPLSVIYFLLVFLSYFLGPYVNVYNDWRFYDAYQVLISMLKIFVFYFIGLVCINDQKKLKFFAFILPFAAFYLTYWANMQYLSGRFFIRLAGPRDISGAGIYGDENNFAMLFVVALPFFFYLGWYFRRFFLRLGIWFVIPFSWHAIFLTASRGGLVGAAFVSFLAAFRSPKKVIGILLIPAFLGAFFWQGGSILKERAKTFQTYKEESSARTRLEAWDAGLRMLMAHPFTGVGIASFGQAFPFFSDKKPRVAHNTFIQIAAESGIFAGISYVLFMFYCVWGLFKSRDKFEVGSFEYYMCDAVLVSLCGFLVCSLFLTLNGFEVQFYLAILANSLIYFAKQKTA